MTPSIPKQGGKARSSDVASLRAWLEYVAATAIEMLDDLEAASADLEDDELGDDDAIPARAA